MCRNSNLSEEHNLRRASPTPVSVRLPCGPSSGTRGWGKVHRDEASVALARGLRNARRSPRRVGRRFPTCRSRGRAQARAPARRTRTGTPAPPRPGTPSTDLQAIFQSVTIVLVDKSRCGIHSHGSQLIFIMKQIDERRISQ